MCSSLLGLLFVPAAWLSSPRLCALLLIVDSQCCKTITPIRFQKCFIILSRYYKPVTPPSPLSPAHSNLSCAFSPYLLQASHVRRSTQHSSFCIWPISLSMISSRFTHVVACVRTSFPLKVPSHLLVHLIFTTSLWSRSYCNGNKTHIKIKNVFTVIIMVIP